MPPPRVPCWALQSPRVPHLSHERGGTGAPCGTPGPGGLGRGAGGGSTGPEGRESAGGGSPWRAAPGEPCIKGTWGPARQGRSRGPVPIHPETQGRWSSGQVEFRWRRALVPRPLPPALSQDSPFPAPRGPCHQRSGSSGARHCLPRGHGELGRLSEEEAERAE